MARDGVWIVTGHWAGFGKLEPLYIDVSWLAFQVKPSAKANRPQFPTGGPDPKKVRAKKKGLSRGPMCRWRNSRRRRKEKNGGLRTHPLK